MRLSQMTRVRTLHGRFSGLAEPRFILNVTLAQTKKGKFASWGHPVGTGSLAVHPRKAINNPAGGNTNKDDDDFSSRKQAPYVPLSLLLEPRQLNSDPPSTNFTFTPPSLALLLHRTSPCILPPILPSFPRSSLA